MQQIDKKAAPPTGRVLLPLIVMMLWGSLFPFIKIGYRVFAVDTDSVAQVLMFAAMRFAVCGAAVCIIALVTKAKLASPKRRNAAKMCLMGVFAVALHYGFTYVGLTMTDSGKTAILKQIAPLLFSCFSFLFVREERFSVSKLLGALVGFCGILAINVGAPSGGLSRGDVLILSASVCTVVSMVISGKCAKGSSPLWITGISQLFGGAVLLVTARLMGGKFLAFTPTGAVVFLYICAASVVGYTLFYYVQRTAHLSNLFIIKFAEPLFACLFGALLLGENVFKWQYGAALLLISGGIALSNRKKV